MKKYNHTAHRILYSLLFMLLLGACKKADSFKDQLDGLPQINNESRYQYRAAYGVGDTLVITGLLHPERGLKITVGGIDAPVVLLGSVPYSISSGEGAGPSGIGMLDQASIIITEAMGLGANRPVNVITAGNTIQGAAIEIYGLGGEGSFDKPLKLLAHATPSSRQNVYLHCINGKGVIYFYGFSDKNLYRTKKDGSTEVLLTETELQTDQNGSFVINTFLAGGVNPQGTMAWVSVQTSTGYQFCEVNLATKKVNTLNSSTVLAAPYEGAISGLETVICGIYPDSKGKVYTLMGSQANNASAIAEYSATDKTIKYLFRAANAATDVPGAQLGAGLQSTTLRFLPEEAALYVFVNRSVSDGTTAVDVAGLSLYNLSTRIRTGDIAPYNRNGDYPRFLGPFNSIALDFRVIGSASDAGINFGFMPMPGQRLQFLLYSVPFRSLPGFPKWDVIDFNNERFYQYAPGTVDLAGYTFGPVTGGTSRIDELLNYDEQGHLYMTANGRSVIVKTAIQ